LDTVDSVEDVGLRLVGGLWDRVSIPAFCAFVSAGLAGLCLVAFGFELAALVTRLGKVNNHVFSLVHLGSNLRRASILLFRGHARGVDAVVGITPRRVRRVLLIRWLVRHDRCRGSIAGRPVATRRRGRLVSVIVAHVARLAVGVMRGRGLVSRGRVVRRDGVRCRREMLWRMSGRVGTAEVVGRLPLYARVARRIGLVGSVSVRRRRRMLRVGRRWRRRQ
jgi:hypothetical protein